MTKQDALRDFRETILPHMPKHDKPMLREAWNEYTDALCKNRLITDKQYHNWSNPF